MKSSTKGLLAFSIFALFLMGLSAWGFVRYVDRALMEASLQTYSETVHSIGQSLGTSFARDLSDIEARIKTLIKELAADEAVPLPMSRVYGIVTLYTDDGCAKSAGIDAGVCKALVKSESEFGIVSPHISSVNGIQVFNIWAKGSLPDGRRFWLSREYEVNAFTRQMVGAFGTLKGGIYVVDAAGEIVMRSARGGNRTMHRMSDFIEVGSDAANMGSGLVLGASSTVLSVRTVEGNPAVMFMVPLFQKNGWSLVGIVPESAFRGDASGFLYRAFLLILICCLGVGVFMGLWFHVQLASQRRENALIQEKMQAYSASEAKSRFLSNMTHDMRTPLNAITGMTAIALRSMKDPERVVDSLKKIDQACRLLLGIVNDVLDMSRIESGKMTLISEPVNLPDMMAELRDMMAANRITDGKTLTLTVGIIDDPVVSADPSRLRQVVLNILTNAVKYTPPNGRIDLSLSQFEQDGRSIYRFRCTDNGMGMDENLKKRLFQPFERAIDSAVNRVAGVGLGLSITKSLVDMMQGHISVTSEIGRGTDIIIDIPFEPVTTEAKTEQAEETVFDETAMAGVHVLVVEDNDINAEVAAEFLAFMGVTSERAANGREALDMVEAAEPGHFAMVFMDIQMPVMDGLEASRQIRAKDRPDLKTLPIVALTANAFTDESIIVKQAGMNDCLSKPIDMKKLFLCVSRWAKPA